MKQMKQMGGDGGDPRPYAIIGAAMEVHRILGAGFPESVYHHAFSLELGMRGIGFAPEVPLPVAYKGHDLGRFRADFICFDGVIVELKALARLSAADDAQMLNYLKAAGKEVGILLNFGAPRREYGRLIRSGDFQISSVSSADPRLSDPGT